MTPDEALPDTRLIVKGAKVLGLHDRPDIELDPRFSDEDSDEADCFVFRDDGPKGGLFVLMSVNTPE